MWRDDREFRVVLLAPRTNPTVARARPRKRDAPPSHRKRSWFFFVLHFEPLADQHAPDFLRGVVDVLGEHSFARDGGVVSFTHLHNAGIILLHNLQAHGIRQVLVVV
ncbi:hypothetical protein DIPPA_25381 [Diplonema papillatum]|nr:hypothetical protein DIPPA_25381 [Diplonema papillatum]